MIAIQAYTIFMFPTKEEFTLFMQKDFLSRDAWSWSTLAECDWVGAIADADPGFYVVLVDWSGTVIKDVQVLVRNCPVCRVEMKMGIPYDGYVLWQSGVLIQQALPMLNANDHEILISGMCPRCWERSV